VYSDTVFFLGNFSKNLMLDQKILFWFGASSSSFVAFFLLGYLSKYLSKYLKTRNVWKVINLLIVIFMSALVIYVFKNIFNFLNS
jgi:L-lysine exporter family protein LysE/ArgO